MTTVATSQVAETMQQLAESARLALDGMTVEDLVAFEKQANEVEAYVREVQQSMWAKEAKTAIRRLRKGEPLDVTDRAAIRTFLVSDAERYVAVENNLQDWKRELRRLTEELTRRAATADRDTMGDLRGLLKDLIRLVPDIRNLLSEQRRVEKFDLASADPDQPTREMIAKLLQEQLHSEHR